MPKGNLKKTRVLVPAVTAALVVMMTGTMLSTTAFAQELIDATTDRGLKFVNDPVVTVNKDGDTASLSASGEVSGAGTGGTATLSSTAEVTVGCIVPGASENEPQGLQTEDEDVVGEATLDVTRNGRGTFDFTTDTVGIPSDFDCPSRNMEETLVSVLFTDITLTVTTDEGKSITATFTDVDP